MSIQLLGHLRATNPQVALVSDFDIDTRDPDELQGVDEVDPEVNCQLSMCVAGRAEHQVALATIERLEREALLRLKKIQIQTRKLRRLQKVVTEVSAPGWKLTSIKLVVQIL